MSLTITQEIGLFILFIGIIGVAFTFFTFDDIKHKLGVIFVSTIITAIVAFGLSWYNTSTASGIRNYKDFKSELSNGMYRELTITAEDGREIFKYEGKFDIEINKDNDNRYLRFESEDGKRRN